MNNENPECFSESCRAAFRTWLRQKYGTLDELNARWGTVVWSQIYSDWAQIDLPFPTPAYHNPALMLDFKRFISASATDYLNDQVEILRRYRPNDFLTHNGVFKNINYYTFSRDLDLYAYDNYPTFEDSPRYPTGADADAGARIQRALDDHGATDRTRRPDLPAAHAAAGRNAPLGDAGGRAWRGRVAALSLALGAARRGGILVWRARSRQRPPRALRGVQTGRAGVAENRTADRRLKNRFGDCRHQGLRGRVGVRLPVSDEGGKRRRGL